MSLKHVNIDLKDRSYSILFNDDWETAYQRVKRHKTLIVTDGNVADLHLKKWMDIFGDAEHIIFPPGEDTKSITKADVLYTHLISGGYSRDTLIAALGGGVIGDFAGFAAATFMRGVDLLHIPTTLLAMVDAAIGGKTGINHPLGKNLIGAFYQPKAVFIDTGHLDTLPRREWICGMGEVIKYGLIKDRNIFEQISVSASASNDPQNWISSDIIRRCVEIKGGIVVSDERESSGERLILNFGHTIGHAIEAETGFSHFQHGEAVAAGMAGACFMSKEMGMLSSDDFNRIINLLKKIPLPEIPDNLSTESLIRSMIYDKKVKAGKVRFVLLTGIGQTQIVTDFTDKIFFKTLEFTLDFLSRNY